MSAAASASSSPQTTHAPSLPKAAANHTPQAVLTQPAASVPKWRLSPNVIRLTECSCTKARHDFTTPQEYLAYQLDRFDKVWSRIAHITCDPEVLEAAERVVRQLRGEGVELAHFAGFEVDPATAEGRREISILLLVPSAEEGIGHRWVAEVLVHLDKGRTRNVENVAVRYSSDWQDWTVSNLSEYSVAESEAAVSAGTGEGEEATASVRVLVPRPKSRGKWDEVIEGLQVHECVQSFMKGARLSRREIKFVFKRILMELEREGKVVTAFEVQRVYRLSKSHSKVLSPAVRIAFRMLEGQETDKDDKERNSKCVEEPGAVLLVDYAASKRERKGKVKSLAVLYEGEWPVFHHYRQNLAPPDVSTLEGVLR